MRLGTGRRIAIGALVVAALVTIAWRSFSPNASLNALATVDAASAEPLVVASLPASAAAARSVHSEPPSRPRAVLPPARKASEVEVCGVGIVDLASSEGEASIRRASEHAQATLVRVFETMKTSPDEGVRAFGIYWGGRQAGAEGAAALRARQEDCGSDEDCQKRVDAAASHAYETAARASADALARTASASRDPMAYAVAMQACRRAEVVGPGVQGACQLISAEQWARLDPDNAIAWLHVAGSARARKDVAAEAEALQRVAAARESRLYADRLPDIALSLLSADVPALERQQIAITLIGMFAAWTFPGYQAVTQYCSDEAVRDTNRSQSCDALASALVSRGTTLIDLGIGMKIGERVGWPAEKVGWVKAQRDAIQAISSRLSPSDDEIFTCRSLQLFRTYLRRLAGAGGELGAARLAIQESGRSTAELNEEYRVWSERTAREFQARDVAEKAAQAAASAASAGS
jgi:hypothetical protein